MPFLNFLRSKKPIASSPDLAPLKQLLKAASDAWQSGDLEESAERHEATIAVARTFGPDGEEILCRALSGFSVVEARRERLDLAESLLDSAIDIIAKRKWQNTSQHLLVMNNMGSLRWAQGQHEPALKVFEHVYAMAAPRATTAADQSTLATILDNLIVACSETGATGSAMQWFVIAREHCHRYGRAFPNQWSWIFRVASLSPLIADPATLVETLNVNAAKFSEVIAFNHPATTFIFAELGSACLRTGQLDAARDAFAKAYAPRDGKIGLTAKYQLANGLGMLALAEKQFSKAETYFKEMLAFTQKAELRTVSHGIVLNNLGVVLREQGRLADAEPLLRQAIQIFEAKLGPNHFHPANAMKNVGQVRELLGHGEEAGLLYEEALDRFRKATPTGGPVAVKSEETRKLLENIRRK